MQSEITDARPRAPVVTIVTHRVYREAGENHFGRVAHQAVVTGSKLQLSTSWALLPALRMGQVITDGICR